MSGHNVSDYNLGKVEVVFGDQGRCREMMQIATSGISVSLPIAVSEASCRNGGTFLPIPRGLNR